MTTRHCPQVPLTVHPTTGSPSRPGRPELEGDEPAILTHQTINFLHGLVSMKNAV